VVVVVEVVVMVVVVVAVAVMTPTTMPPISHRSINLSSPFIYRQGYECTKVYLHSFTHFCGKLLVLKHRAVFLSQRRLDVEPTETHNS